MRHKDGKRRGTFYLERWFCTTFRTRPRSNIESIYPNALEADMNQ